MVTIFMYLADVDIRGIQHYFKPDTKFMVVDGKLSKIVFQYYMDEMIKRCIAKREEMRVLARNRDSFQIFRLSDVYYVSSYLRKVQILGNNINIECYNNLSTLEEPLDCLGFCRISGSYIVSMNYIKNIAKMNVTMTNGEVLSIGRKYYKPFCSRLEAYPMLLKLRQG